MEIKPGTIGLTRIKGFVGVLVWLLQAINGDYSKWTHVFVVLDNSEIFEAEPGGAKIVKRSKYFRSERFVSKLLWHAQTGREVVTLKYDLTDAERAAIVATARSLEGIGYNWTTYFYLAAYRLRIPGLTAILKRRVENSTKLICSQAADYIYMVNGKHLFDDGRLPYDVTPGDIARLIPEGAVS